jgi:hypothetical protein
VRRQPVVARERGPESPRELPLAAQQMGQKIGPMCRGSAQWRKEPLATKKGVSRRGEVLRTGVDSRLGEALPIAVHATRGAAVETCAAEEAPPWSAAPAHSVDGRMPSLQAPGERRTEGATSDRRRGIPRREALSRSRSWARIRRAARARLAMPSATIPPLRGATPFRSCRATSPRRASACVACLSVSGLTLIRTTSGRSTRPPGKGTSRTIPVWLWNVGASLTPP